MRKPLDYMFLYAKGLCIGAIEVLHGVSGGSMALILGIYQELVSSIRSIDRKALSYLKKNQWKTTWKKINGNFLLTLVTGIITGWLSLLWLIGYLHHYFFIPLNAFFFGFIFVATLLILRKITVWNFRIVLSFFVGLLLGYTFTILTPLSTSDNLMFALLAGIISVCSMLIPGISGAFILLLLGKYQYIVTSFIRLNVGVIAFFLTGCIIGLAVISRVIRWMLAHYQSVTVALLAGLTIGALNKLWPWRNVKEYASNGMGDQIPAHDESVLPWDYVSVTGKDPHVLQAILMMALGVFIMVLIEKVAARLKTKI